MALTPLDIQQKQFPRALRGYREQDVDEFLDQVVREFEHLYQENQVLKEEVASLNTKLEHYRQLEETLRNTLLVAQGTAEELKAGARKEAELIIREAQLEADRLTREAEARVVELKQQYEEMQRQAEAFRAKVRSLLESQLAYLDASSLGEPV